jgi:hypothetical protein
VNASLGYTAQHSDLQPTLRFVSGSLYWNWAPPSHFKVNLGVARSTDGGAASGSLSSLNDRSLNTTGSLNLTYELTAKVSLVAGAQYALRKYSSVKLPAIDTNGAPLEDEFVTVSGTNHTSRVSLSAHYQPTRTTDLSCSAQHEIRSSGSATLALIAANYTDNLVQCVASISFD